MYSAYNEGKSVIAERFIRTLKNEIYKYLTSVPKNVFIHKLDDIVNKYNNTYNIIKMKPVDVKSHSYVESSKDILYFKLVILLQFQNIKTFLQNLALQIGLKNFL